MREAERFAHRQLSGFRTGCNHILSGKREPAIIFYYEVTIIIIFLGSYKSFCDCLAIIKFSIGKYHSSVGK